MSQQTRIEVVEPAWERFVREFPTPADFASADDDTVQRAWRGLGYYRRAKLLRDGAQAVVERHGGEIPRDPDALRALPGVGEYTQAALASIAFGHPMPAIDGNLERVLARHAGIDEQVKTAKGKRAVREAAITRFEPEHPGDWNQAVMDLGSAVCTPRSPTCSACPVAEDCCARLDGRTDELPVLPARRKSITVAAAAVWVQDRQGRVLGATVPPGQINAGQLDLPGPGPLEQVEDTGALRAAIDDRFGVGMQVDASDPACIVRHGITHHRITMRVFGAKLRGTPRHPDLRFADPGDPGAPWTTIARKAFAALGDHFSAGRR